MQRTAKDPCHSEGAKRPWESQQKPGKSPRFQMRLPRRGFTPPRNDMRFMVAVPNDKPQSCLYAERIIATCRESPKDAICLTQLVSHCQRALPAKTPPIFMGGAFFHISSIGIRTWWARCARSPWRTDGWYGRRRTCLRTGCSSGTCGRRTSCQRSRGLRSAWR